MIALVALAQSMQVGAEALSGFVGGALAAVLVKLPLLVFAGAAVGGGMALAPRLRGGARVAPATAGARGERSPEV